MLKFSGLDLSLKGSACVCLDEDGYVERLMFATTKKRNLSAFNPEFVDVHLAMSVKKGDQSGDAMRNVAEAERVMSFIAKTTPSHVSIEEHAFQMKFEKKASRIVQLAQMSQMVRYGINNGGLEYSGPARPYRLYSPGTLKAFALCYLAKRIIPEGADKPSKLATKEEMIAAAEGQGFSLKLYDDGADDLADAYWSAQLLRLEVLFKLGKIHFSKLSPAVQKVLHLSKKNGAPLKHSLLHKPFVSFRSHPE